MFIKKVEKNGETYFILTICEKVEKGQGKGKDNDTHFISVFIPEALAIALNRCGVEIKEKVKKVDEKK